MIRFSRAMPWIGLALVMACSGGSSPTDATAPIVPVPPPTPKATLTRLVLTPDTVTVDSGAIARLNVVGVMSDGSTSPITNLSGVTVGGTAADALIQGADVVITGRSSGTASITVSAAGVVAQGVIVVKGPPRPSLRIRVSPSALCIRTNTKYMNPYVVLGIDSLNVAVPNLGPVAWTSQDTTVAVVDSDGNVTSRAAGHTTVTGVVQGLSAVGLITVDPAPMGTNMTCQ